MSGTDRGELLELAREAMRAAYAPYSGFRVGAALEAEDGRRFSGCNVENAASSVTMCAERVALGSAVRAGARRFRRLALCASGPRPVSPCGVCRQALSEFGVETRVVSVADGSEGGDVVEWSLEQLLPARFGAGDLGVRSTPPSAGEEA